MNVHAEFLPCTGAHAGAATDLVLLHGWGSHGGIWADVLPALRARHHVTVIDLPGFGFSQPPRGGWSLESLAASVFDAAPPRAAWIGWSLGGMVATCLAINEPARVRGLAVVGANLSFVQRTGWPSSMPVAELEAFAADCARDPEVALARFQSLQCAGASNARDVLRRLRGIAAERPAPSRDALLGGLDVLRDADLRAAATGIACPALWLFGGKDALVPPAAAAAIARRVPGARTAVLPDAAHVPFLLVPDAFLAVLRPFLDSLA